MDVSERNALVLQFVPLVWSIARRMYGWPAMRRIGELEDVVQEGCLALIAAAENYDPRKKSPQTGKPVKFLTYAHRCVCLKLHTAAKNHGIIRVPIPSHQRLIKAQDLPEAEWDARVRDAARALAIRPEPDDPNEFGSYYDQDLHYAEDLRRVMDVAFTDLPEKMQEVIRARFGLQGCDRLTQGEIGDRLGITKQRVQQIERDAMALMAQSMAA